LVRAAQVAAANWMVAASVFAYSAILMITYPVAALFGILGGFLVSLVFSACAASFLYLVEMLVRSSRVTLADFQRSFLPYLGDVVGITFLLWIFWQIAGPVLASTPHGEVWLLSVNLFILVFLNAVPELIYLGHHSSLALITESYAFITENWVEWFPPNLVLAALFVAFDSLPTAGVADYVRLAVLGLFVYFAMVFRGFLFLELSGSTRRSRRYRYRMSR
jgi:hypothetical protein